MNHAGHGSHGHGGHGHERHGHGSRDGGKRYGAPGERLRMPERVALLEIPRVLDLGLAGLGMAEAAAAGTAPTVLDVGTGTGLFAEAFLGRGMKATGIDPNPDLLEAARRLVPGAVFQDGTAEHLPFPDRSFDVVMMSHVLHETDAPRDALLEARRVARLRVLVLEWPYVDEDRGPPLAHRLRPSEIEDLAKSAGLVRIERIDLSHMQLYRLTP